MALRTGTDIPELTGATGWLNGEVTSDQQIGSPTLVHFWAVSCYICKDNMPALHHLKNTYGAQGLKLVAVHMPRQEEDLDTDKVEAAIAHYGINEPCAIDNEHTIGDRFETAGLWPHYFLFDAEGKLRGRSAGNAGLARIENTLQRLLAPAAEGEVVTPAV